MLKYRTQLTILLVLVLISQAWHMASAETWHLKQGQDWESASQESDAGYLLAVSEIKQMVNTGQTADIKNALAKLKKDFPQISGPDLDAFIKAEILFSKAKFVKAMRVYDSFLVEYPESKLYEAVIDRQFAIATAFLAGQKKPILKVFKIKGYAEGAKIMEGISDRAGNAPIAIKAAVAVAKSYENRGKFNEAYNEWSHIASRWPTGQIGKESLLAMARCKHAAYRGPNYDSSSLISAKSYYENFKLRYPVDAEKFEIAKKIEQTDEQLAYKQFHIGQYYQKTNNKQSSNLYYQMVIDNWPQSIAAKMAQKAMNEKGKSAEKEKEWKINIIKKLEKLFL